MGVDYGSKLAGTTTAAMLQNGELHVWQCAKDTDADKWLQELISDQKPGVVYIDAPLTLPKVYSKEVHTPDSDFFYRAADREVQAMSPMFIGGLTARAIRLRTILAAKGVAMLETYPSALVRLLLPQLQGYKKDSASLVTYFEALQELIGYKVHNTPQNWHQLDAILCWISGNRHNDKQAILYGDSSEGRIIV